MSRPFMPFYDGDWMRDTAHLNDRQERAYFRLVMFYWANGSLPNDEKQLALIAHQTKWHWRRNREIISHFFSESWQHKRIEKELEKSRKFSEKQRANAASGNAKRWPKDRQTIARARVPQPYREGSLDLDPTLTIEDSISPQNCPSQTWTSLFEEFWKAWPNKVGKPAARRVFDKLAKCPEFDYEAILVGIERYKRQKPTDRPWLNPATFLNQERWNDEPASTTPSRSVGKSNGSRGATEAFLNGDADPAGREESTGEIVPLLPTEWRRE